MSITSPNRFICHLWRITRKSQSSVLLSPSTDSVYVPEFPPNAPTGDYWVFGTTLSESQGGTEYYNASCGVTVYFRSQVPINNTLIPAVAGGIDPYRYIGSNRTRLMAISQTDYNNKIITALTDLDTQLRKKGDILSSQGGCYTVTGKTAFTDALTVNFVVYEDPAQEAIANSLLDPYPQLDIAFYELGQESTAYNLQCEWQQSTTNGVYTQGVTYTSDRVGNVQGAVEAVRIYITNGQYAYSVTHNGGQVTEPIYITHNGNPIYPNNYPNGDVAVALLGIKNIICLRVDDQTDNGGNRDSLDTGFNETIVPLGFTDHDRPIDYNGLVYLPYYGGSVTDYTYSASGEAATNEVDFAIALEGISEADLLSGIYNGAEVVTYHYDWANNSVVFQDAPGYFGKIKIHNSRNGAYKYTVELNSVSALLQQKESEIITSYCDLEFGGERCGVNLLARGLVDTLTVSAVNSSIEIVVNSSRADNYYGRIEFEKNGIIYTHLIAKYTASSQTLESWDSIVNLEPGDTIKAVARCDRTSSDCQKYQGNKLRFGGFENIPKETSLTKVRA